MRSAPDWPLATHRARIGGAARPAPLLRLSSLAAPWTPGLGSCWENGDCDEGSSPSTPTMQIHKEPDADRGVVALALLPANPLSVTRILSGNLKIRFLADAFIEDVSSSFQTRFLSSTSHPVLFRVQLRTKKRWSASWDQRLSSLSFNPKFNFL
ncbi:hypothetical protein JX265_004013 [Neoarthrinium moseri]|uniref:Uncharacterized protein n=1 Tax=Neoarthrinium moseri TaxID=1658444 RepID=A0A9Q0AT77_9PEZI|nr:uncharacterized protein JN550_006766 [Neoarthrinium moseri]KAI1867959.1 hypothetical protein JN550_006766 [Neoarthrinium moseri]KAI1876487.1 hypothetical protein JX265_004013 [Neoarthrinium moseri]